MKNGLWKTNGEPICFNKNGDLLDGQHRLHAIVHSGVSLSLVVVSDVDNGINTYDIGIKRSTVDIASATDKSGRYNTNLLGVASMFVSTFLNTRPSSEFVANYAVTNHDDLANVQKIIRSGGVNGNGVARNSGCGVAAYIFLLNGINIHQLMLFFSIVNSGYPMEGVESSPAITLRNYLISQKIKTRSDTREAYNFTFQAICDFLAGNKRKRKYKPNDLPFEMLKKCRELKGLG